MQKISSSLLIVLFVLGNVNLAFPKTAFAVASKIRQEINIVDGFHESNSGNYGTSSEIVRIDTSKYSGTVTYYFEVVASTTASISSNVYLRTPAGATIATAAIPTGTTNPTRLRSSSFTPTSGANEYVVVTGNESGAAKSIKAARVIVIQDFAGDANSSATSTETQIEIGNKETGKTNTTNSALSSPKYWTYSSSKWDGTLTAYAQVTFKTGTQAASTTSYTTSGYTTAALTAGTSYVTVAAWGAGGGGATGAGNQGGAGGGGGAFASSTVAVSQSSTLRLYVAPSTALEVSGATSTASTTDPTLIVAADGGEALSAAVGARGGLASISTGQVTHNGGTGGDATTGNGDESGGGGGSGGPNGAGGDGGDCTATTVGCGGGGGNGGGAGGTNAVTAGTAGTSAGAGGTGDDGSTACTGGGTGTLGGGGGGGGDDGRAGCNGGAPGGGGGGGELNGGTGAAGKIILTEIHGAVGIAIEEDDGNFVSWSFKKMIATTTRGIATSTSSLLRSDSFTPINGRHYRIVASSTSASVSYDIYNAQIVVNQTTTYPTTITKLEPQYLLATTKLASGIGLQNFLTNWDSTEWSGVTNTYLHAVDAADNSTSVVTLEQADGGGTLTNSTVTSPDNHATSTSAVTMPASENLDMKAATNNGDIYGSRILVQASIDLDPALDQLHYRWRNDNGGETGANWLQTEDSAVPASFDINLGVRKRLRILISNSTVSASGYQYRLQQASSSCTTWYDVPTTESVGQKGWVIDLSGQIANFASTTNFAGSLTDPGGKTFAAGYVLTSSNQTNPLTLTSSQFTELEYSIKSTSQAETGLLYCFRVTNAGSATNFTYSVQPQITLSSFNRGAGGNPFESGSTGSIITGGGVGGGGGSESGSGGGSPVGGGGQGGGGGDVGGAFSAPLEELSSSLDELSYALIILLQLLERLE